MNVQGPAPSVSDHQSASPPTKALSKTFEDLLAPSSGCPLYAAVLGPKSPTLLHPSIVQPLDTRVRTILDLPPKTLGIWLRQGVVREKIRAVAFPDPSAFAGLSPEQLNKASLNLSSMARAFYFRELRPRDANADDLPPRLVACWDAVCRLLGRDQTERTVIEDFLYNYNVGGSNNVARSLKKTYLDLNEEFLSAGLQGRVECNHVALYQAVSHLDDACRQDDQAYFFQTMTLMMETVVQTFSIMKSISTRAPKPHFDAVVWAQSYPELGKPATKTEPGSSGTDSPSFHFLDSFFGFSATLTGEMAEELKRRRSHLPKALLAFFDAVEDNSGMFRAYAQTRPTTAASYLAAQHYLAWLHRSHRTTALANIALTFEAGRTATAGGVHLRQPGSGIELASRVSQKLDGAARARFGELPRIVAEVCSKESIADETWKIELRLPCPLALEPGDRIRVLVGDSRERLYSVGQVTRNAAGNATRVALTVKSAQPMDGQPPSVTASFFSTLQKGSQLPFSVAPAPEFRLERKQDAVLCIGQGSGVGPFMGMLSDKAENMTLIAAAKTRSAVPYLNELQTLSLKTSGFSAYLALSQERGATLRAGVWSDSGPPRHAQDVLLEPSVKSLLRDFSAVQTHIYVCGGTEFGRSMRQAIEQAIGRNFSLPVGMHDDLPTATVDLRFYHDDLFSPARGPAQLTHYSWSQVALHNSPASLWTVYDGTVYDLTKYAAVHPGNVKTLLEGAGLSISERLKTVHAPHLQEVTARMAPYAIGYVCESEPSTTPLGRALANCVRAQNHCRNNSLLTPDRTDVPYVLFERVLPAAIGTHVRATLDDLKKCDRTDPAAVEKLFSQVQSQASRFREHAAVCVRHDVTSNDAVLALFRSGMRSVVKFLESTKFEVVLELEAERAGLRPQESSSLGRNLESDLETLSTDISELVNALPRSVSPAPTLAGAL